jgi:hypothetical protein
MDNLEISKWPIETQISQKPYFLKNPKFWQTTLFTGGINIYVKFRMEKYHCGWAQF